MPLVPAITDIEQLRNHPAVARLLAWKDTAVQNVKFDRGEMTIFGISRLSGKRPAAL